MNHSGPRFLDEHSRTHVPAPEQKGSPWQISPVSPIGKSGGTHDEGFPRAFLLQQWITIRGSSPVVSVTQQDSGWLDLGRFADAAFWVEVAEVTVASGGAGATGTVSLFIESSPTMDETNFRPVAPPLVLTVGASPGGATVPYIIRCVRTPNTAPLSRWTRWRIESSVQGDWDVSFRIRGTAGSNNFLQPTMIKGCFLWLRADLGVTVESDNSVLHWEDQSGLGAVAQGNVGTPSFRPQFNLRPINGQPTIAFDNSNAQSMFFNPAIALPPWQGSDPHDVHAFVVHRRVGTGDAGFWTLYGSGSGMPLTGQVRDDCYSTTLHNCGAQQFTLTTPHVYEVVSRDTSFWGNWLNGIPQFNTNTNTMNAVAFGAQLGVSGANYYSGDWAEMFLYSRVLTTAERGLVIDYLNGRYGLGAV